MKTFGWLLSIPIRLALYGVVIAALAIGSSVARPDD